MAAIPPLTPIRRVIISRTEIPSSPYRLLDWARRNRTWPRDTVRVISVSGTQSGPSRTGWREYCRTRRREFVKSVSPKRTQQRRQCRRDWPSGRLNRSRRTKRHFAVDSRVQNNPRRAPSGRLSKTDRAANRNSRGRSAVSITLRS